MFASTYSPSRFKVLKYCSRLCYAKSKIKDRGWDKLIKLKAVEPEVLTPPKVETSWPAIERTLRALDRTDNYISVAKKFYDLGLEDGVAQ